MNVDPKTIQTIMRHSNIKTTLNIYVKAVDETRRDAMDLFGQNFATCNEPTTAGNTPVN
jgi:hypothetical protein